MQYIVTTTDKHFFLYDNLFKKKKMSVYSSPPNN